MKDLIKYLRHYIKESILAPLFKMLEASFELFVPLVMAAIIDTGIKNSDKPYIFKMGMVLVGLAIVGFISALSAQYFAAKAAVGFGKELRGDLCGFSCVHRSSLSAQSSWPSRLIRKRL